MVDSTQLHDSPASRRGAAPSGALDADTAMILGQLTAQMGQLNSQMPEFAKQLAKQTDILTKQQIDITEYWSGLRKANDDIQLMRDSVISISNKLDKAVPIERFEKLENHVKTLNGTDNKFRSLGINLDEADQWRDVLVSAKKRHETNGAIKLRVLQGVVLAVAMALGAAMWNGLTLDINSGAAPYENSTSDRAQSK